ncbi:transcriptional regulator with XRE-family HTH domain [Pseudomonas migulae]|jgi:transcriptional regulator with XRE-family HTH domain|uniref:helix-turn-helix domain-containing protein n=1 Tax=Pseudomonas TaxID=286 RepID=UPI00209DD0F0|nr:MULTISPECIES: helix-turn-helix transcriptional regulator [Pseudomonas]MCP1495875.1 transcriptional regulator with XRE-family HTH domain [Pseudomonas migulae]MCU1760818.1 helix-turn-helix domain-containing protein [Pseudomonas sp. 14P_8.1_Bac3]
MELKQAFGAALKKLRSERKLSQEDFSDVSSRTYLSTLERGLKSPTIEKVDDLATVMGVHPLTILVGCYLIQDNPITLDELFSLIRTELPSEMQ